MLLYMPAFPEIAKALHCSLTDLQFTFTAYMVGAGISSLAMGPLSDRYGRKPPLLWSIALFIGCSLAAIWARDLWMMLLLRLGQGIGSGAPLLLGRVVLKDLYPQDGKHLGEIFSTLSIAVGVVNIGSPLIGELLENNLGWPSVFAAYALIGGIGLLLTLLMPETHKPDPQAPLRLRMLLSEYGQFLRTTNYRVHVLVSLLVMGSYYAYSSGSTLIFIKDLHTSEGTYAIIVGSNAAGIILGNLLNDLLIVRYHRRSVVSWALPLMLLCVAGCWVAWQLGADVNSFWILFFGFSFTQGMLQPNIMSLVLSVDMPEGGTAAALQTFLQYGSGLIASAAIGSWHHQQAPMLPALILISGFGLLAWGTMLIGYKKLT